MCYNFWGFGSKDEVQEVNLDADLGRIFGILGKVCSISTHSGQELLDPRRFHPAFEGVASSRTQVESFARLALDNSVGCARSGEFF